MSALPPNVLQNSLPHCDSAIIESDWTVRQINVAHFRLILNQYCARYPLKIVLQHIPPESGHSVRPVACPLCANSGHRPPYSITLLARASKVKGMVRPSDWAVLRLITNSNSVGACTGSSAGLTPLKIRST